MPSIEMTNPAALPADWRDILALTKPRVMSLVVFSGLCGMLAAPQLPPLVLGFTAILCIALGAGACGALNQWYEADLDAKMRRTAKRPLPDGRMDRQSALHFGVGLGAFSVLLMGLATNWLAAALLAVSILFYVLVYTVWLKPRTPQNIVIGGAAGAFPPLIGWVAATGHFASASAAAVRDHLPVDPAAFLGAVDVRPLGLCGRGDPDAAGGRGHPEHAETDFLLQPADGRRGGRAMGARADAVRSTELRRPALSLAFVVLAALVFASRAAEPAEMRAEKRLFGFLGALSVRAFRRARRRPVDRLVKLEDEVVRRQRERARITAWLLGAFVVLLFFITIAKTGINW